jgi:cell division protein FtsL
MTFLNFKNVVMDNLSLFLMIVAIIVSSMSVVYTKHKGRVKFVELQKLEQQRDRLDEEWGRLLLEESTWAGPGRIEQEAKAKLNMITPTADMVVVVKQ